MPYKTSVDLFTDVDPNGPVAGQAQILTGNDARARFRLCGAGGILSDDQVAKFNLSGHEALTPWSVEQERAERDAANRATYAANIGISPAHRGYPQAEAAPTPAPAVDVAPEPTGEPVQPTGEVLPEPEAESAPTDTGSTGRTRNR